MRLSITLFILTALLVISQEASSQTVLNFSYDASGNQILRQGPVAPNTTESIADSIPVVSVKLIDAGGALAEKFLITPIPFRGEVALSWESDVQESILYIELISLVNNSRRTITSQKMNRISIDLSDQPAGLYIIMCHLDHPAAKTIQKKVIKY